MNTVAVMMARGDGSTLKRKNAYPILGKPMLWWALTEAKKAKFIKHVFVWTENEELIEITKSCGCEVVPRSENQISYHSGFSNPNDWGPERDKFIVVKVGPVDVKVDLNCNYVLMTAEILETMFWKLMEDPMAKDIWPISEVHGHYFIINPNNNKLFPVWHCQDLDRQTYPKLYIRGSGICISHLLRRQTMVSLQSTYYEVPAKYLLDVHDLEDVELAEFYLSKRNPPRGIELSTDEVNRLVSNKPGSFYRVGPRLSDEEADRIGKLWEEENDRNNENI